jgi:UDP-N-acetylglucosamine 1-carboxyvinyltransferase
MLTPERVTITNIPDILDVNLLIELLAEMNVKIERPERDTCIFQANDVDIDYLHSETFRKKSGRLRGSVMLAGQCWQDSEKLSFRSQVVIRLVEED